MSDRKVIRRDPPCAWHNGLIVYEPDDNGVTHVNVKYLEPIRYIKLYAVASNNVELSANNTSPTIR